MAFHYTTQGIILKRQDRGEANRSFVVFTKDFGKLSLWAVSVRKNASKLRSGLQPFSLSQLSFVRGKNKKVLVEALVLEQYLVPLQNLSCLQVALRVACLVDEHMGEQEQDKKVWEALKQVFCELQEGVAPERAYQSFVPGFMSLAGYGGKVVA
jgi:DNA repair protein RecO (recombination protein O)